MVSDVSCSKIEFDKIKTLLSEDPHLARRFYYTLARQLSRWVSRGRGKKRDIILDFSTYSRTDRRPSEEDRFKQFGVQEELIKACKCDFYIYKSQYHGFLFLTKSHLLIHTSKLLNISIENVRELQIVGNKNQTMIVIRLSKEKVKKIKIIPIVEKLESVFEVLKAQFPPDVIKDKKIKEKLQKPLQRYSSKTDIERKSLMSSWDWSFFLTLCPTRKGKAKDILFNRDDPKEKPGRLYVVSCGACTITTENETVTLYADQADSNCYFGVVDFYSGSLGYMHLVQAEEDHTCITIIEPQFLNIFMQHYPEIVLR